MHRVHSTDCSPTYLSPLPAVNAEVEATHGKETETIPSESEDPSDMDIPHELVVPNEQDIANCCGHWRCVKLGETNGGRAHLGTQFSNEKLKKHLVMVHKKGTGAIICPACANSFANIDDMISHDERVHEYISL